MNNIPVITKNLLIINILMFFAQAVTERMGIDMEQWLGLHFVLADHFYVWQFVTYVFLHGNLTHLFFNMFALFMFGCTMERTWGPQRFLLFFLVCGVGAGLTQEVVQLTKFYAEGLHHYEQVAMPTGRIVTMAQALDGWNTIGASGAVYGILLAFGLTYPEQRLFIFPLPVPIPAKYFVIGYAVIELMCGFGGSSDGVAHFAHLGGMLFGWLVMLYWSGRLRMPKIPNPFERHSWRGIINEAPLDESGNPDEEWNTRRRNREIEVDRILDKVRKHGYGSLTEREKRVLFNAGQK